MDDLEHIVEAARLKVTAANEWLNWLTDAYIAGAPNSGVERGLLDALADAHLTVDYWHRELNGRLRRQTIACLSRPGVVS